jgi:hypothetical protein
MFDFKTEVRLNADAPPEQIVARLASITAAPFSMKRSERGKPLRGRPTVRNGFLRWPLNQSRIVSPRPLRFELLEAPTGSVLAGAFKLMLPLRVVALAWLACANIVWIWTLANDLVHRANFPKVGHDVLFVAVAWFMATGYLWITVAVGRRRDRDLIRVLRVVLASEAGAAATRDLLYFSEKHPSFIDDPIAPSV